MQLRHENIDFMLFLTILQEVLVFFVQKIIYGIIYSVDLIIFFLGTQKDSSDSTGQNNGLSHRIAHLSASSIYQDIS